MRDSIFINIFVPSKIGKQRGREYAINVRIVGRRGDCVFTKTYYGASEHTFKRINDLAESTKVIKMDSFVMGSMITLEYHFC